MDASHPLMDAPADRGGGLQRRLL